MGNNQNSEIIVCEICGAENFKKVFSGGDKLLGIDGDFQIIECLNCGIYLLSPKISQHEMEKYYPEEYICFLEAIEDDKNLISRIDRKRALYKRCRQVNKVVDEPGRILDIGCATGIFLNGMKELGWEVMGIEPNSSAAEYARKRFNIDVVNGYLNQVNLPTNSFDVISVWDVLEHVPNIDEFLHEILRILKPTGTLIGSLPNAKSWERYLFGEFWVGWEIPRHYRSFTPETLSKFLCKSGFSHINIFSFIGRHGAFMISVDFWLNGWNMTNWKKKIIRSILGSKLFRILSLPYFIFAEKLNRSNNMSFSAKKPDE